MKQKLIAIILILLLTMSLLLVGCNNMKLNKYQVEFLNLFDTVTQIVGYAKTEEEFLKEVDFIYEELEEYYQLYDIYNNYEGIHNLKTINDNAGIKPIKVDQKIIELLLFSKEMNDRTNGYVNVVFGSVLSIWHEYRQKGNENPEYAKLPPIEELEEANKYTDISKIIIDEEHQTVFLEDENMLLDVGGIAKGYAVQRVADEFSGKGFTDTLINVGGNVCAIGGKPDASKWKIGIQNPKSGIKHSGTEEEESNRNVDESFVFKVPLENETLVTSGNYQRYYSVDGKQYHHIINQNTLMPSNYFASVSIICDDSGIADALSTAIYNMTYEEGKQLLKQFENVKAVWVYDDGHIDRTENFINYTK